MTFKQIYNKELIFEKECWKKCGNGFCCNNENINFDFRFIKTKGSSIFYLPREFNYANTNLKTHFNQFEQSPIIYKFRIEKNICIGLVQFHCDLLGHCKDKIDKPLLCRAYPFLPVYDYNNKLKQLVPASIFDMVYDIKKFSSPCKINDYKKYFKLFSENNFSLELDVYAKFYLKCLALLFEVIRKNLEKNTKDFKENSKLFWSTFEMEYLSGNLFYSNDLKKNIKKEFLAAQKFDPLFNLATEDKFFSDTKFKIVNLS